MSLLQLVVVYLVVSIAIGVIAAKQVHSARDYITAGRHLPMPVVFSMVFATWFGAETVLGNSGTFLNDGISGLFSDPLGAGVCLVVFGLFFAKRLYRMNLLTLGDFFRVRYNRGTELALSICIVVSYLGWVGAQVAALGLVFNLLSDGGVDQQTGMVIGAGVVLLYTLLGGLWSVAVTETLQMVIIVAGLLFVTWVANDMAGGFSQVWNHAVEHDKFRLIPENGNKLGATLALFAAFFTMTLGSIPQQDVFQRVNSSRNERIAVWGTTFGGLCYILFALVPVYLAYSTQLIDPGIVESQMADVPGADSQKIMPLLVMTHMSFVTQVIFFGALLSVIMSTASGTLLAPSVTFSENVLRGFLTNMTDKQLLWTSRITVIVFAVLVTIYTVYFADGNIHTMVENAYRITLAGAFVPLAAGLFSKRANNLGAALAIGLGLTTWVVGEILVIVGEKYQVTLIPDIVEPHIYGLFASALGMATGIIFGRHPAPTSPHHRQETATASNNAIPAYQQQAT
jgi:Na+/proline symporter